MNVDVDGRSVLITGAARGLGLAYARYLADRGARVVLSDIDAAEVRQAADALPNGVALPCDVSEWDAAGQLVADAEERVGPLDAVINNAGIFHVATVADETMERVRRSLEVNLLGTVAVAHHALRRMTARRTGVVVNTTSKSFVGMAGMGTYGATKAAIVALTRAWSLDLADAGVAVVAFAPKAYTRMSTVRGVETPDRNRPPDRVAPVIAGLLCADPRSINGAVLGYDGNELVVAHPPLIARVAEGDGAGIAELVASGAFAPGAGMTH
ncbi:SDR family oxidoreductase [Dactylosporangium roseum]|uniref:SDR family oxidoreductase n=1 Tax=Dactylosporangium roseum TaxID=47989 RepID=A0ABY5YXG4_9ACTN|nr:SDR family oxidoreductase [Dactylosporangium roseum]UWZ34434.1 SDR family oxidoreductase [Dactylosporangium roseum]